MAGVVVAVITSTAGVVFAAAVVGKVQALRAFLESVAGFGLGRTAAVFVAVFVSAAEGSLGALLIARVLLVPVTALALCLAAGLGLVSAYAGAGRKQIPCLCFGRSEKTLGRGTLGTSGALIVALSISLVLLLSASPAKVQWRDEPAVVALVLGLLAAWQLLRSARVAASVIRERRRIDAIILPKTR